MVQLHGKENEKEIQSLRAHIVQPIIKAFCVKTMEDIRKAKRSSADYILLDSGAGTLYGDLMEVNKGDRTTVFSCRWDSK